MSDTPNGETVNVEPTKNDVTPQSAPPVATTTGLTIDPERLKVLEQQEMRANQLANQLKAKEEAEAQAKQKELEEQNQFKDLFEQEKARREALEQEQETKAKQAELSQAKTEVLSDFSEDVKALATEVGLELLDTAPEAVEAFKAKLDKLSEKVSSTAKVTPNNPRQVETKSELTREQIREASQNDANWNELIMSKYPGIAAMTGKSK